MSKAVYNDHVAALSFHGGLVEAIRNTVLNPLRLAYVEFRTRFSPVFA